jgi:hypothetical protein
VRLSEAWEAATLGASCGEPDGGVGRRGGEGAAYGAPLVEKRCAMVEGVDGGLWSLDRGRCEWRGKMGNFKSFVPWKKLLAVKP